MPPKKKGKKKTNQKQLNKKREKVIEDKTFGLKNKNRSSKVQKYITNVRSQVYGENTKHGRKKKQVAQKKKRAAKQRSELESLYKSMMMPIGGASNRKKVGKKKQRKQNRKNEEELLKKEKLGDRPEEELAFGFEDALSLEKFIREERLKVKDTVLLTTETFNKWKEEEKKKKNKDKKKKEKKKKLTGREQYLKSKGGFIDAIEAMDVKEYEVRGTLDEEEEKGKEKENENENEKEKENENEKEKENEKETKEEKNVEINEDLFGEENLDDLLDEIDDED
ncbi:zinc finger ccch domain-containing protein [Anaeramoeba flamelloides]|uniref:Zinc finger ccch domain-containing protein n=1 Tax=Anaeramoeba flamelloides TaxID=1746091 RepID=A0AAV7YT17_9EUKA|nr:zinc finger ccch domain-containing protein [Anaeramoeba flamelloides]